MWHLRELLLLLLVGVFYDVDFDVVVFYPVSNRFGAVGD